MNFSGNKNKIYIYMLCSNYSQIFYVYICMYIPRYGVTECNLVRVDNMRWGNIIPSIYVYKQIEMFTRSRLKQMKQGFYFVCTTIGMLDWLCHLLLLIWSICSQPNTNEITNIVALYTSVYQKWIFNIFKTKCVLCPGYTRIKDALHNYMFVVILHCDI